MRIHLDFELRSKCELGGQNSVGTWNYSMDPSTSILCLQYAIDSDKPVLSHPAICGLPAYNWPPKELLSLVMKPGVTIHAHNAFFERSIWKNVGVKRYGWPEIDPMQWRCTLAVASYFGLPRSLEKVADALRLPIRKDMAGAKILKLFMKPMANGLWYNHVENFKKLCEYCGTDVEVERAIEERLGDLPEYELKIWLIDQIVNEYGILFDKKFAGQAIKIASEERARANIETFKLTNGLVEKTTDRNKFFEWTKEQGYDLTGKSLTKDTIPELIKNEFIPEIIKDCLKLRSSVSAASVNKYKAMLRLTDSEGLVRDTLQYGGANTMRWAGKGVQIHNFPRGYSDEMEWICQKLADGESQWVESFTGDRPMQALKKATRGSIIARPGNEIHVADYSGIEARCLMWLVGDTAAIDSLAIGDIYCDMASAIYGQTITKKDKDARQLGKQAILGCGYGMGYPKFFMTLQSYKISLGEKLVRQLVGDQFSEIEKIVIADTPHISKMGIDVKANIIELIGCKFIVDTYRAKYPLVKNFWREVETAARDALKNQNERQYCGKISYLFDGEFLKCRLPSGRDINYFQPKLEKNYTLTFWGENPKGKKIKLRFDRKILEGTESDFAKDMLKKRGYDLISMKPDIWETDKIFYQKSEKKGLKQVNTYGGSLTENICQAISRDLIAEAMVRAYETNLNVLMTVHDELVIEEKIGKITIGDFEKLICVLPDWAQGFPINAEGFTCKRYRK